ncbi:MarR family winged helix-turn-helix transcriptional regulator [Psychrosphaera sp. F3M07]|uniref:MarR family winged helix-turn-helix transcriptional regulator n=1 Tax=Psychrosphaera aquimarina TaxID=2044854 RepID=A0ABU3R0S5_9GAMM|nr:MULTISPECIES: MarR family winged helix-turn-helix transcriptional regulator [Psychrosphaera]MBU2916763.1 MarR family winged helix-turn-helix transcriptional regulator [Psychrosphaera sp. F3M07]MDU0113287.1 MarR family winged helix-turn-helix transcriptional regulator [Psychrosphaera aquimarina]
MEKYEELFVSIRQIIRAIDLRSKKLSKAVGITGPQLLVLQEVLAAPGLTSKQVADGINLSQATVTSILDRLEAKQLLVRKRDSVDRRKVSLYLTDQGHLTLNDAPKAMEDSFIEKFENIENWEQTLLLSSVQRIASMMNAEELDAAPMLKIGEIDSITKP